VGSGISGLSAGWLLSQSHDVTLFEAGSRLGCHSNTVSCASPVGAVNVDAGFIVYNEVTYPNLVALFDYLDVPTVETNMGFSVSINGGRIEYAGGSFAQLFASPRNLIDPSHWQMLAGIARFFRTAALRVKSIPDHMPLGAFLENEGYGKAFIERHLLPMAGAIWSSAPEQMLSYPAKAFVRFFDNHALLNFGSRTKWRTILNGSQSYVNALVADSRMNVLLNGKVACIKRDAAGVSVESSNHPAARFDKVVLAVHADQALRILDKPTHQEYEGLSAFSYATNRAVLHRDPSFMPKRRKVWSSWNCVGKSGMQGCSVTYWMNALQPLASKEDYFVSLNPERQPAEELIEASFEYSHPVFDSRAMVAQKQLWTLQGQHHTWYCGAHFGSGFHEDGLQSGLAVAEALGGALRPWQVENASGRIHLGPAPVSEPDPVLVAAE
jgi:uncharacterized protein